MNSYDLFFFSKYVVGGHEIKAIIHRHIMVVIGKLFLNYFFGIFIPCFIYIASDKVKSFIPFFGFEIFLILMFLKIIYTILDRYNDVWIVTESGLIDLDWQMFNSETHFIEFEAIEGIEIIQDGILDNIFGKGQIIAQKMSGEEEFFLDDVARIYKVADELHALSKEGKAQEESESENSEDDTEDENEDVDNQEYDEYDEMQDYTDDIPPEITNKVHKIKNKHHHNNNQNMDYLLEVLSGVVKEYMTNSGYKKDDSKEKKEKIISAKKQKGTIDLR